MAQIVFRSGSIFDTQAQAIVVTVNTVGFMGKGMALECALRYADAERHYKDLVGAGLIQIGHVTAKQLVNGPTIVFFPTKTDFRFPSRIEYITAGLNSLSTLINQESIRSIAIPHLGASLGKLDWKQVEPLVLNHLSKLEVNIEIWEFSPSMDELSNKLLDAIYANPGAAARDTKLPIGDIERICDHLGRGTLSGFVDFLQVPRLGKAKLVKLLEWDYGVSYTQQTLFD